MITITGIVTIGGIIYFDGKDVSDPDAYGTTYNDGETYLRQSPLVYPE